MTATDGQYLTSPYAVHRLSSASDISAAIS